MEESTNPPQVQSNCTSPVCSDPAHDDLALFTLSGVMRTAIASATARIALDEMTEMIKMIQMITKISMKNKKVKKFKNIYNVFLEPLLQKF